MATPEAPSWLDVRQPAGAAVPDGDEPSEFVRLWRGFMTARVTLGVVLLSLQAALHALGQSPDRLLIYGSADNHDAHCGRCGSMLYSLVRDAAYVHVTLGTLIDPPSIRPSAHIFAGSKAPWFAITDDLPQYEEHVTA